MRVESDNQGQTGSDPALEAVRRRLCPGRLVALGPAEDGLCRRGAATLESRDIEFGHLPIDIMYEH